MGMLQITQQSVSFATEDKIKCSNVMLDLKNIKYYGDKRSGLVGYWKLDEGSGSTSVDSSGQGNDGTLSPATGGQDKWVTGKRGNALNFDGSNDYI